MQLYAHASDCRQPLNLAVFGPVKYLSHRIRLENVYSWQLMCVGIALLSAVKVCKATMEGAIKGSSKLTINFEFADKGLWPLKAREVVQKAIKSSNQDYQSLFSKKLETMVCSELALSKRCGHVNSKQQAFACNEDGAELT